MLQIFEDRTAPRAVAAQVAQQAQFPMQGFELLQLGGDGLQLLLGQGAHLRPRMLSR